MTKPKSKPKNKGTLLIAGLLTLQIFITNTAISAPAEKTQQESENVSLTTSKESIEPTPQQEGFLRVNSRKVHPIVVWWKKSSQKSWIGDAIPIAAGKGILTIESPGFHPLKGEVAFTPGKTIEVQSDFTPIENYRWVNTSGWLGVGIGAVLAVAGIAVHDVVEFDSPAHRETAHWSLIGGGGALFLSGTFLLHHALHMQASAKSKPLYAQ